MRSVIVAITPVAVAAFGGGFAVFGGYDDAPGATLLGAVLVLGAMVFAARAASEPTPCSTSTG